METNKNEMVKEFSSVLLSVGSTSVALITFGTIVSILAGLLSVIYTTLKIYDWIKNRKKS